MLACVRACVRARVCVCVYTWTVQCVRMDEKVGKYRGECVSGSVEKVIIGDKKLQKHLKGKLLEACMGHACINGLGIPRICKLTQENRSMMKELREEIGMKKHLSSWKQNEMGRTYAKNE